MILLLVLLILIILGLHLYSSDYCRKHGVKAFDHFYGVSVWGVFAQFLLLYFIVTI